jgi:hypothetical protein
MGPTLVTVTPPRRSGRGHVRGTGPSPRKKTIFFWPEITHDKGRYYALNRGAYGSLAPSCGLVRRAVSSLSWPPAFDPFSGISGRETDETFFSGRRLPPLSAFREKRRPFQLPSPTGPYNPHSRAPSRGLVHRAVSSLSRHPALHSFTCILGRETDETFFSHATFTFISGSLQST